jgi:hypothetical protein
MRKNESSGDPDALAASFAICSALGSAQVTFIQLHPEVNDDSVGHGSHTMGSGRYFSLLGT